MYGGGGGWPKVFLIFFLDNKTSAPEVFCCRSLIPHTILRQV